MLSSLFLSLFGAFRFSDGYSTVDISYKWAKNSTKSVTTDPIKLPQFAVTDFDINTIHAVLSTGQT